MKTWLLDTGPIVAYLDLRDPAHREAAAVLNEFDGRLVSTSAVVTEAMYFVTRHVDGPRFLVDFLETSGTEIVDCCQLESLERATDLMARYADTPMDFADATLVLLAESLNQHSICTLDRRGFSTFRTSKGKQFRLVLDDAA